MKKYTTVEQIGEKLFELEKKHSLLDLQTAGVKIWQLMRMPIYYDVARAVGVLEKPHSSKKRSKLSLKKFTSVFVDLTVKNPFLRFSTVDSLILPHHRRVVAGDKFIDIYTDSLIKNLECRGKSYAILEKSKKVWHLNSADRGSFGDLFLRLWGKVSMLVTKENLNVEEVASLRKIESLLNQTFNIKINIYRKLLSRLRKYKAEYGIQRKLLERLRPKCIYIVVSYSWLWGGIIKVAKDLGIPVIELQHGVFSRYHLGYSYPENTAALDFFPDKLFTWGSYWSNIPELPLDRDNIVDYGFTHFHDKRRTYHDRVKNHRQILILSQEAIGERLARKIYELSTQLNDYQLVYKLHPSEYTKWEQREWFSILAAQKNISIVAGQTDLYALFSESAFQIGVFSTAIFEGIGMGCKTILIDLPGVEYMDPLIKEGLCLKYDGTDSISNVLNRAEKINSAEAAVSLFGQDVSSG